MKPNLDVEKSDHNDGDDTSCCKWVEYLIGNGTSDVVGLQIGRHVIYVEEISYHQNLWNVQDNCPQYSGDEI